MKGNYFHMQCENYVKQIVQCGYYLFHVEQNVQCANRDRFRFVGDVLGRSVDDSSPSQIGREDLE